MLALLIACITLLAVDVADAAVIDVGSPVEVPPFIVAEAC